MENRRVWASLDPFLERGPIMGRTQANRAFFQALLERDPFDEYRLYLPSDAACAEFVQLLRELPAGLPGLEKVSPRNRRGLPAELARAGHHVFHLSDCIVHPGPLAAVRNAWSGKIFPITSVTHSLSYARYGQDFLKHLSPCTTPRDAVVATSRTAAEVVRGYYAHLREGYGLDVAAFPQPAVETIPLGVDTARHAPADPGARNEARARLGFGEETVFLVLARLCLSSKMDFLPILRAFHRLALADFPLSRARLALAGFNDQPEWGRKTLEDLARNIGLPLTVVEKPSEDEKLALYQACDVFLSPSDNLQETFGLSLLEAQAAGLPVIASDFDGYRDLVLPEATGLLVETIGPSRTEQADLLAPLRFDSHTHLVLAQRLAVDVGGLADAIRRLAENPPLRQAMGAAGRRNALSFSWHSVVERHEDLWERLWERDVPHRPVAAHPSATPYARVFAAYPGRTLAPGDLLAVTRLGNAVYRGQDHPVIHAGLESVVDKELIVVLLVLARKPRAFQALTEQLLAARPELDAERVEALALWCLKHDLLERRRG